MDEFESRRVLPIFITTPPSTYFLNPEIQSFPDLYSRGTSPVTFRLVQGTSLESHCHRVVIFHVFPVLPS